MPTDDISVAVAGLLVTTSGCKCPALVYKGMLYVKACDGTLDIAAIMPGSVCLEDSRLMCGPEGLEKARSIFVALTGSCVGRENHEQRNQQRQAGKTGPEVN